MRRCTQEKTDQTGKGKHPEDLWSKVFIENYAAEIQARSEEDREEKEEDRDRLM